jgi:hypothetical protein
MRDLIEVIARAKQFGHEVRIESLASDRRPPGSGPLCLLWLPHGGAAAADILPDFALGPILSDRHFGGPCLGASPVAIGRRAEE